MGWGLRTEEFGLNVTVHVTSGVHRTRLSVGSPPTKWSDNDSGRLAADMMMMMM